MTQATAASTTFTPPPQPPARQLCPYCGHLQAGTVQCEACRGLFEPLSRQATQNSMGPWQVRDASKPFSPACSFETIRLMVQRGRLTSSAIVRGPTTRQFWQFAIDTPGIAVLLGRCHACRAGVATDDYMCRACGAVLMPSTDRQHLGLSAVQAIDGAPQPAAITRQADDAPLQPAAAVSTWSVPAPAPQRAPATIAEALHIDPSPQPNSATTRALRREVAAMRAALTITLVIGAVVVGVLAFVILKRQPAAPVQPPAAEASKAPAASPSVSPPQAQPVPAPELAQPAEAQPAAPAQPLDAALNPWAVQINEAEALAKSDSKESLERALDVFKRVREQAIAASPGAAPQIPLLAAKIEALESRLDKIKLREMF